MNHSIIKIVLSIIVILTSFSFQSCTKETSEITPSASVVTIVSKTSIIGTWRSVKGKSTTEREFTKGSDANHGSGIEKITTFVSANAISTKTVPFDWTLTNSQLFIRFIEGGDMVFIIDIINNGGRLLLFDDAQKTKLFATCERVN